MQQTGIWQLNSLFLFLPTLKLQNILQTISHLQSYAAQSANAERQSSVRCVSVKNNTATCTVVTLTRRALQWWRFT